MSEINIPERHDYKAITPFRLFVKSNFPFIESTYEALDNYGLYCKVVEYLNQVIDEQNKVSADMVTFTDFVTNYFENLDVQEEINNKLDEMVTSGELQELLNNLYNSLRNEVNSQIEMIDEKVDAVASGSPAGTYATVSALQTADPNHNKIYVVIEDGKWYYYNTTTASWTAGGTYQASPIGRGTPGIDEIYDYYDNILFEDNKSMTASLNTSSDIYPRIYMPLKANEWVHITVTDSSSILSSNARLSISEEILDGYTEFIISDNKIYYKVKHNTSFLRLAIPHTGITDSGNVTYNVKRISLDNGIIDNIKKLNDKIIPFLDYIKIPDIKNKTGNLFNDVHFTTGKNVSSARNLFDMTITDSSVAKYSDTIRIKDDNGDLYTDVKFSHHGSGSATVCWLFDANYNYIGIYKNYTDGTSPTIPDNLSDFDSNAYYMILVAYPTVYTRQKALYTGYENTTYNVGSTYDYTSFTDCLKALANDTTNKTILVHDGTYNLYNEYGGDNYFNNLPELQPSDWHTYCALVPENTKIIGVGKVTLQFLMPNDFVNQLVFSSLNISKSCEIENINIYQTNGRYLIHVETGTDICQSVKLKNITLTGNSYNSISLGCGISEGTAYNFENIIDNTTNTISIFNHTNSKKGSFINIRNCIFNNKIALQNWSVTPVQAGQKNCKVNINNSYISTVKFYSVVENDTISDYKVQALCTNDFTIENDVVTDYDIDKKLVI